MPAKNPRSRPRKDDRRSNEDRRLPSPKAQAARRRVEELCGIDSATVCGGGDCGASSIIAKAREAYFASRTTLLPLLLIFREVGRTGSYNEAGKILHLDRGNVREQVRELEKLLGAQLAKPVKHIGVRLTSDGERLWRFSVIALAPVDERCNRRLGKEDRRDDKVERRLA